MAALNGYDFDNVVTAGVPLEDPCVIISGRTHAEYTDDIKQAAQRCPVYIRGSGRFRDHLDAAYWKVGMIRHLGVTRFFEDHPLQCVVIRTECPEVELVQVPRP